MLLNCGAREDSRVPWTARRSNQSILKEIIPGCSLEGLMLKLKLQYFGLLMWRADLLEKTLKLGKIEGRRMKQEEKGVAEDKRVGWHHWLDGHEFEQASGVDDGQGSLACCSPGVEKSQICLGTDLTGWKCKWQTGVIPSLAKIYWQPGEKQGNLELTDRHITEPPYILLLNLFFKVFLMWTNCKVSTEFVTILSLSYAFVFWPRGMLDLSSPTRDQNHIPHIGRWGLKCWTAREVPLSNLFCIMEHRK